MGNMYYVTYMYVTTNIQFYLMENIVFTVLRWFAKEITQYNERYEYIKGNDPYSKLHT